ncbi:MAG: PhzF family phenazine biosynthesis protein, partial [Ruminococcaceae bacterium]|nr:PhzF family phenazine biosynthesis protein [Oscillospiraceae bacterium]
GTEVDLCGHATLASSFVVLNFLEPESDAVRFHTRSGLLTVRRADGLYRMDFPIYEQEEIPVTDAMEKAFGVRPIRAFLGVDLVCVFENEETVRAMTPDQTELSGLPGRIQNATARGRETDCVSRSFFPKIAITEDPVCGSAHCQIAPYWAGVLGKRAITAYQASKRGGTLHCELTENGRITIGGEAVLVAKSEVMAL